MLGTNCRQGSEMKVFKTTLSFELTSVEENFGGRGSRLFREFKASSYNLVLFLTFFFFPYLFQPHLFQWCNSLHLLLVTSHLQAIQRRENRGQWSQPSPKWTTVSLGKASGQWAPCSLLSALLPLLPKHMRHILIMDSYVLNTKSETSRKRR